MEHKKTGNEPEAGTMINMLKELQDELFDLKERCNDAYNRVVELTGKYMLIACDQEASGDKKRKEETEHERE